MVQATVEGQTVKVGDWVGFKSDIEQSGRIVKIQYDIYGAVELVLENLGGFEGEYLRGETRTLERASDCWVE